jgi:hypothetical protein
VTLVLDGNTVQYRLGRYAAGHDAPVYGPWKTGTIKAHDLWLFHIAEEAGGWPEYDTRHDRTRDPNLWVVEGYYLELKTND